MSGIGKQFPSANPGYAVKDFVYLREICPYTIHRLCSNCFHKEILLTIKIRP